MHNKTASKLLVVPLLASCAGPIGRDDDVTFEQSSEHRLQQLYRGVPVFDGSLIVNGAAVFDRSRKGLAVDTDASLSAQAAIELAQVELGGGTRAGEPTLGIHTRYALRRRGPGENAADFERAAVADRLAWRVRLAFPSGDDGEVFVDARDGKILEVRSAVDYATGHSQYSGDVTVKTINTGSGTRPHQLVDNSRGGSRVYMVTTGVPAADADNLWGDGNALTGSYDASDSAATLCSADSQTAAVDAAYGYGLAYDMYRNVFNLDMSGWDRNGAETDLFVHGSGSSSFYSSTTDVITFVDGSGGLPRVAVDSVAHEFTHRVDSHTGGTQYTMKEGIADIFACLAKVYRTGGATGATIPDAATSEDWHQFGEYYGADGGRFLYQPDRNAGAPSYWFSSLSSLDEHDAGALISRAFYFTSEGASAHVNAHASDEFASYSDELPWGLPTRSGPDGAGRVFYMAFTQCLENDDYNEARQCAELYAGFRDLLAGTHDLPQVKNAFAGINVGALDSAYPAPPPTQYESESNETTATADALSLTHSPAGYESVSKARVSGTIATAADVDVYSISVGCFAKLGAIVSMPWTTSGNFARGDFEASLYSASSSLLASSDANGELGYSPGGIVSCPFPYLKTYYLKVKKPSALSSSPYLLRVDAY